VSCRHHPADQRVVTTAIPGYTMTRRWCPKCKGYVSLGPASDSASIVTAEMRAAELAVIAQTLGAEELFIVWFDRHPGVRAGWNHARFHGNDELLTTAEMAGWLTYQILHHDNLEPDESEGICHCGCGLDEHGHDDEHPNSTGCLNCGDDCIAYERAA